jgi:hypothetical protein
MAPPDREPLKKEIIEYARNKLRTKDGKFLIEESLGAARLEELAETRDYEDLKKITDAVYESVYWLSKGGFHSNVEKLLEKKTLDKLYSSLPYKSHQLSSGLGELCERGAEFSAVVQSFFGAVMSNLDSRILWKPMVDELMKLDGSSATLYFMDDDYPKYLQKWDERVALLDEAIDEYGLRVYIKLRSGGKGVELQEGQNFCTTSDGAIYAPAYMNIYDTRRMNLNSIRRGVEHECGHHRWKTFRINLNPSALHLDIIGARLVGEKNDAGGRKCFIVECKENTVEVKRYGDLKKVVKYPKLLAFLHNVADDKRVDTLNMLSMPGIADDYQRELETLLAKRPQLKGGGLGDVLEALLQQTVVGRTNGEVPEKLKEKMGKIASDLAAMEIHEDTDGTDSMNVAFRWYVDLEPELDALAARVVDEKDLEKQLDDALPESFSGSETSIDDNPVELRNDQAGPIVLSRKKRPKGPRTLGIDPLAFLNLPPGEGGPESGEGEPGEELPGQKPKQGEGSADPKTAGGEDESGSRIPGYDEWTGTGYRKGTKHVVEHFDEGRHVSAPHYLREKAKRMFKRYVPKTGELERGLDSGEPDPEMHERYLEEVDAGHFPEPNYHADVVHRRSNAVTTFHLDMSQSMDEKAGDRVKLEVGIEAAALLMSTCHMLRYPSEAGGFCGGEKVEYHIMPSDEDGITISLTRDGGATPMAGAVRHATKRTLALKAKHHKRYAYQFWLCDAEPNCSGDGIDAVVDTAKAVEEARAKGIKLFGIIIADEKKKAELEEQYAKVFGGGWYVVVTTAERMLDPLLAFMKRVAIING